MTTDPYVNIHGASNRGATRSAFGQQTDSRRNTSPLHSFGALSSRDTAAKVFISSSHTASVNKGTAGPLAQYTLPGAVGSQPDKLSAPSYSFSHLDRLVELSPNTRVPGPGQYTTPGAFGDQPVSNKETQPRCKIGTSERAKSKKQYTCKALLTDQLGTEGAGLGKYILPGCIGKQPSSQKHNSPAFSLPKTTHLSHDYEKAVRSLPAPGKYDTWLSIGQQTLSQHKTAPTCAWGKFSGRNEEKGRYISPAHLRTQLGTQSPGNYDHQNPSMTSTFGKQNISTRSSSANTSFGSAPRMVFKTSNTPGPGQY